MKKRYGYAAITILLTGMLAAGCGNKNAASPSPSTSPAGSPVASDAVTSASVVNKTDAFMKAASKDGTWIIATLNDLTFDKEIVVEGEFKNKDAIARKIAPYTQDANHKITNSFTITAPRMTIKSENTVFQGGTFKGDVYVDAKGFSLKAAKIEGNVYFTKEEYKSSFVQAEDGKVTGVTAVQK
jgi:hypothetical protein